MAKGFRFFSIIVLVVAVFLYCGVNAYPEWWKDIFSGDQTWNVAYWRRGVAFIAESAGPTVWSWLSTPILFVSVLYILIKVRFVTWNPERWNGVVVKLRFSWNRCEAIYTSVIGNMLLLCFAVALFFKAIDDGRYYAANYDRLLEERIAKVIPGYKHLTGITKRASPENADTWHAPILNIIYLNEEILEEAAIEQGILEREDIRRWLKLTNITLGPLGFSMKTAYGKQQDIVQSWLGRILDGKNRFDSIRVKPSKEQLEIESGAVNKLFKQLAQDHQAVCRLPSSEVLYDLELERKVARIRKAGKFLLIEGPLKRVSGNALEFSAYGAKSKQEMLAKLLVPGDLENRTLDLYLGRNIKALVLLQDRGVDTDQPAKFVASPAIIWL